MRLLFDQNLSYRLCKVLAQVFPEARQVHRLGLEHADDRHLWRVAADQGFTLVSQDADFAEMAALLGPPPKVIWLRCGNQPTSAVADLLRRHAAMIAAFEMDESAACLEIY